jgi:hypothetical protein
MNENQLCPSTVFSCTSEDLVPQTQNAWSRKIRGLDLTKMEAFSTMAYADFRAHKAT